MMVWGTAARQSSLQIGITHSVRKAAMKLKDFKLSMLRNPQRQISKILSKGFFNHASQQWQPHLQKGCGIKSPSPSAGRAKQ